MVNSHAQKSHCSCSHTFTETVKNHKNRLPLHKYIPQPPYRFPDIFFFHIGIIKYQDILVFFFVFTAEFRKAGDMDVLLAGGPFDFGVGEGGINLDQQMRAAFSVADVKDGKE